MIKFLERGAKNSYKYDIPLDNMEIEENISYIEDELEEHKLDIIYPRVKKEKYPFIINIHGGGFSMNSKDKIYRNYGMRLANNDFAVVNMNFRLSSHSKYPAQMEDVLYVISFIYENADKYKLDINNMFMVGDSSGAYMSAMTGCIFNNKELRDFYNFDKDINLRAIASNCGMFDFTTFMGKDIFFPMKRSIVENLFGTKEYENLDIYRYSSVLKYINEDFPPIYVMDTEKLSFKNEALRLIEVLNDNHIEYRAHIFEKKDKLMHAFNIMGKHQESQTVLEEIFDFFKRYVVQDEITNKSF